MPRDLRHRYRGQACLCRRLIFDQATTCHQQLLEVVQAFVWRFLRLKVRSAAHARPHFCIDLIGLG